MNDFGMTFWPYKTKHGWIVGVGLVGGDDAPTILVDEEAAERLAATLNKLGPAAERPA